MLKSLGLEFECERKTRDSLPVFLAGLWDKYKQHQQLTWHDGTVPSDEIWVKFGGDHGGNSFKLCLQVVHLKERNAKENTLVLAMASAKDFHQNLVRILKRSEDQLRQLNGIQWEDKVVRPFLDGGYNFLRQVIGISGVQGTYPCLWCPIHKKDLPLPRNTRGIQASHKLSQLKADYTEFVRDGKNKQSSKVASYHNVIMRLLLDVMIKQVCPPYLHICLVWLKKTMIFWKMQYMKIDLQLAEDIANTETELGDMLFNSYVKQC